MSIRDQLNSHGKAVIEILLVSVLGIIATAGFQLLAVRGLGPDNFGVFASYYALINIIAIGASALRNSVAVATAQQVSDSNGPRYEPAETSPHGRVGRAGGDQTLGQALVLSGLGTLLIGAVVPTVMSGISFGSPGLWLAVAAVVPAFFFSRAQGLLQGHRRSREVVWWTSGTQLAMLFGAVGSLLLGWGVWGLLSVVLSVTVVGALGCSAQALRVRAPRGYSRFGTSSLMVLGLTVLFAWVTSIDVVLVRSGATATESGNYAAGMVLVKTTLIIPATLALYLLPRYVQRVSDRKAVNLAVNLTLMLTALVGLALAFVVWVWGGLLVSLLYGDDYAELPAMLPLMTLTWLPWALAQALVTRLTAAPTRAAVVLLIASAGIQWLALTLALPSVTAALWANGAVSLCTLVGCWILHRQAAGQAVAIVK